MEGMFYSSRQPDIKEGRPFQRESIFLDFYQKITKDLQNTGELFTTKLVMCTCKWGQFGFHVKTYAYTYPKIISHKHTHQLDFSECSSTDHLHSVKILWLHLELPYVAHNLLICTQNTSKSHFLGHIMIDELQFVF